MEVKPHKFRSRYIQGSCDEDGCDQLEDGSNHTQPDDPRKEVWEKVFQVVSDCDYRDERELVKMLEAAREEDGYGPQ